VLEIAPPKRGRSVEISSGISTRNDDNNQVLLLLAAGGL